MKKIKFLLIIVLTFFISCRSKVKKTEPKIKHEKWVEYVIPINEELDTNKVEGKRTKEIEYYNNNGKVKKIMEYEPSNRISKKITYYDSIGNDTMILTYYDKDEMNGTIEEKKYDDSGNEIKETLFNLNGGEKNKAGIFNITYKTDNKGNIISSRVKQEGGEMTVYDKENKYKNGLLIYSALKDTLGNIISENNYEYDNNKRMVKHLLNFPEINKVKELNIEYKNGNKTKEVEKINGKITRTKQYEYHNNINYKIIISDLKEQKKYIVYIE